MIKPRIDPLLLRTLLPCNSLHSAGIINMSNHTYVETLPPGKILFMGGQSSRWKWYLIKGTVELRAKNGDKTLIQGESPDAKRPLDTLTPDLDIATSKSEVSFIKIDTSELKLLLAERQKGSYPIATDEELLAILGALAAKEASESTTPPTPENTVIESPAAEIAATPAPSVDITEQTQDDPFFAKLEYMHSAGKLEIPHLSAATLQTAVAMSNPNITTRTAAEMIDKDPSLSQYLLRVANSPSYRGDTNVNSVPEAVLRLGLEQTRNLIVSVKLRGIFNTRSVPLKKVMSALWMRSTKVAAASYVLAQSVGYPDPDRALLAGLLHNVGVIPIIHLAGTQEKIPDSKRLNAAIQQYQSLISTSMLRGWLFEDDFLLVAQESDDLLRDPLPDLDLCDIVMLSRVHLEPKLLQRSGFTKLDEVPAYCKLNTTPSVDGLHIPVLSDARKKVDETQAMLLA